MATVTLTADEVKEEFNNYILRGLTDYSKSGSISDTVIEKAISRAESTLSSFIDMTDTDLYGETRIKDWWLDLTYYRLYGLSSRSPVVQDLKNGVMEEIEAFKNNRQSEIEEDNDETDNYFSASEAIIDQDDILAWE